MRALQHQMFLTVYEDAFTAGIATPEQEDQMLAVVGQSFDGGVGKRLPTLARVAVGLAFLYGERSVEQQYALICPARQIATLWQSGGSADALWGCSCGHEWWLSVLAHQLLIDVHERWRWLYALLHREAKPMCLTSAVIGILAQDDHFHFVEWSAVEGFEDQSAWRKAYRGLVGIAHKAGKYLEIGAVELRL